MKTGLVFEQVKDKLPRIVENLFSFIPSGVGSEGAIAKLSKQDEKKLLRDGARWAVAQGYGCEDDLQFMEESGRLATAEPELISDRALERGLKQVGTLGSGNHFLEIGRVEEIYLAQTANVLGLFPDQLVLLIHTGSRGLGYQICEDSLKVMNQAMSKYGISLPDRQLACTPLQSPEGQDHLGSMAAAANYAWANRQVIMSQSEKAFMRGLDISPKELGFSLIYDVCHNIAKIEEHVVDGKKRRLCVHRKGATRAFGPGHEEVAARYRDIGQPVIIGGSMETGSYLLVGTASGGETFFSTAHGSGRTMSRTKARKQWHGKQLRRDLEARGIYVRSTSWAGLAEEAGPAYKNIDEVIAATELAGISKPVARFTPIGNVKG